jgi:RecA-family ATPase
MPTPTGSCVNNRSVVDRSLPHSCEAERSILGAFLLANVGDVGVEDALRRLGTADFFIPEHRVIYRHMQRLHEQSKPTNDIVLLYESLQAAQELEAAGGIGYVSQVPDGLPRTNNLSHYVDIVEQKGRLRQTAYCAEKILSMALGANGNATEVLQEIAIVSAHLREEVGQKRILKFRSGTEFAAAAEKRIDWIAPGYVARGAITEVGAKVKIGKTTLVLNLVRAAADGRNFLDKPTLKTPSVYLTEQPAVSFLQAMERSDLLDRDDFHILSYSETRAIPWAEVAAAAVDECKRVGAALLVVDTLPQFAGLVGDSENNSGDALAAMQPLQRGASDGIGIVVIRHERKSGGEVGDSGRGSSAFAGAVDIVLSLRKPEGNSKKTLRVLHALSRFSETPAELLLELRENGYVALGEPHEAAVREAKDSIMATAPKSESEGVDLKNLIESAVPRATAQRAIDELLTEGRLARVGEGKRGKPFRYFIPEIHFCPTSDLDGQKETIPLSTREPGEESA